MISALLAFAPILLRVIPGTFLNPILKHLEVKANSENEKERIKASIAIAHVKSRKEQWEAQRDIIIAEQQHWFTRSVRPLWALPFILYTWKVITWDMMLGWGTTPELGQQMLELMKWVAASYFIGRSGEKITGMVMRKK